VSTSPNATVGPDKKAFDFISRSLPTEMVNEVQAVRAH
jgi:hypothetical protein